MIIEHIILFNIVIHPWLKKEIKIHIMMEIMMQTTGKNTTMISLTKIFSMSYGLSTMQSTAIIEVEISPTDFYAVKIKLNKLGH